MLLWFACSPAPKAPPVETSPPNPLDTTTPLLSVDLESMAIPIEHGTPWFTVGEFTGDGNKDIVALDGSCCVDGGISALVVAGPIDAPRDFAIPDGRFIVDEHRDIRAPTAAGDFDGDGIGDLALQTDDHDWGDGDGMEGWTRIAFGPLLGEIDTQDLETMVAPENPEHNYLSRITGLGDIDGNGLSELALSWPYASLLFLAELSASGPYDLPEARAKTSGIRALGLAAIGDVDGDGLTELAAADSNPAIVSIVSTGRWVGNMELGALGATFTGTLPSWDDPLLDGGDLDGDGLADLVVGWGTAGGSVCVVAPVPLSGQWALEEVATCWEDNALFPGGIAVIEDLDGDGRDELAMSFGGPEGVHTYLLDSDQVARGAPLDEAALSWDHRLQPLAAADLDGDGREELVGHEEWLLWVIRGDEMAARIMATR